MWRGVCVLWASLCRRYKARKKRKRCLSPERQQQENIKLRKNGWTIKRLVGPWADSCGAQHLPHVKSCVHANTLSFSRFPFSYRDGPKHPTKRLKWDVSCPCSQREGPVRDVRRVSRTAHSPSYQKERRWYYLDQQHSVRRMSQFERGAYDICTSCLLSHVLLFLLTWYLYRWLNCCRSPKSNFRKAGLCG